MGDAEPENVLKFIALDPRKRSIQSIGTCVSTTSIQFQILNFNFKAFFFKVMYQ